MTENSFMMDAEWEEITYQVISCLNSFPIISRDLLSQFCVWLYYHQLVKGYCSMPIVKQNPQWWMVEILDGFGAHMNNLYANQERSENKILILKYEGDSSQVNQAYDKKAAKSDKRVQRINLSYLLSERRYNINIIDQWELLCCGFADVRHSKHHHSVWEGSYIATNLHPSKRV